MYPQPHSCGKANEIEKLAPNLVICVQQFYADKVFLFDVQPAIAVSIRSFMRLDKFSLLGRAQPPLCRHMLLGDHHKLFERRFQSKNLGYASTKN
jgi:hypothetical protein